MQLTVLSVSFGVAEKRELKQSSHEAHNAVRLLLCVIVETAETKLTVLSVSFNVVGIIQRSNKVTIKTHNAVRLVLCGRNQVMCAERNMSILMPCFMANTVFELH